MARPPAVDLTTRLGSVVLDNPVMTASGTAGHGHELADHLDPAALGAVVVKSLHAEPCDGNPAPRVHATPAGMVNSMGLQGPGVEAWLERDLPPLLATGARVVASIWGRTVEEFARAAELLAGAPSEVVAVEEKEEDGGEIAVVKSVILNGRRELFRSEGFLKPLKEAKK